jgi:hypothetical protein
MLSWLKLIVLIVILPFLSEWLRKRASQPTSETHLTDKRQIIRNRRAVIMMLLMGLLSYDLYQIYVAWHHHQNYYDILRLETTKISQQELLPAYQKTMWLVQMEQNRTVDPQMKNLLDQYEIRVNEAFETLSHSEKRLFYDYLGDTILRTCGKACTNLRDYYRGAWHQSLAFYVQFAFMGIVESFLLKCRKSLINHFSSILWLFLSCMAFEWYLVTSAILTGGDIWIISMFPRKILFENIWLWRECVSSGILYAGFLLPTDQEYDDIDNDPQNQITWLIETLKRTQAMIFIHLSISIQTFL